MTVAADPDVEILEALDFDAKIPCYHVEHDKGVMGHSGDGWAIVTPVHECLVLGVRAVICKSGWDWLGSLTLRCEGCGAVLLRDQALRVVEIL